MVRQPRRWARHVRDALIEPIVSRDVLLLSRVDKPTLLCRPLDLALAGMAAFAEAFRPTRRLLVGGDGIDVETFLLTPVEKWLGL